MKFKSIIVDDEKHGRENPAGRQTLEIRFEICTSSLPPMQVFQNAVHQTKEI